jgi:hypothetical protein
VDVILCGGITGRDDSGRAAGLAQLGQHGGDVVDQVAVAAQQMGELGVADVGRAVDADAGVGVPWRARDADAFPPAQGCWDEV